MKKISLIGRVNVGKSTLFNSLTRTNSALVGDMPALTRDYQEGVVRLFDVQFILIDTPGFVLSKDIISQCTNQKLQDAINQSDLMILVFDGKDGINDIDLDILNLVRQKNKPFLCLINKSDVRKSVHSNLSNFYEYGIDPIFISAMNKSGFDDFFCILKQSIDLDKFDDRDSINIDQIKPLKLAIMGRPNVGKSTLINALMGVDRVLVSEIPGTTRDTIYLDYNSEITIIDTAGISKKLNKKSYIEKISAKRSTACIGTSTVVLSIFDANEGITKQDLLIINDILQKGRPVIIGINKIDLLTNYSRLYSRINKEVNESISQVKNLPIMIFSALKNKGINEIFNKAKHLSDLSQTKISTSKLNNFLKLTQGNYSLSGKIKLKYITQTGTNPIEFIIFSNVDVPVSYQRYIRNSLSEAFNLSEIPILINWKKNHNPYITKSN